MYAVGTLAVGAAAVAGEEVVGDDDGVLRRHAGGHEARALLAVGDLGDGEDAVVAVVWKWYYL